MRECREEFVLAAIGIAQFVLQSFAIRDIHKHAGHSGARPGGETHFSVRVVSESFAGVSRVERQRRVYAALADLMKPDGIHALALTTLTPAEVWQEH